MGRERGRPTGNRGLQINPGQKIISARGGRMELANQLEKVSKACKMMGYSRDSFYRFKELYDKGGELALQEISRKKLILANRTAPEIEARIVEFSLEQPAFGQIRVANEMRKLGHSISPAGVRGVWQRHAGHSLGESQDRKGGSRRVRERMPGLLRRAGHVLCWQHERGRPHLPTDLHRHLFESDVCQTL